MEVNSFHILSGVVFVWKEWSLFVVVIIIIISTAGALRIGSPGDFRPTVKPSTYRFSAFKPVYTKAFSPVSGSGSGSLHPLPLYPLPLHDS